MKCSDAAAADRCQCCRDALPRVRRTGFRVDSFAAVLLFHSGASFILYVFYFDAREALPKCSCRKSPVCCQIWVRPPPVRCSFVSAPRFSALVPDKLRAMYRTQTLLVKEETEKNRIARGADEARVRVCATHLLCAEHRLRHVFVFAGTFIRMVADIMPQMNSSTLQQLPISLSIEINFKKQKAKCLGMLGVRSRVLPIYECIGKGEQTGA